MLVDKNIIRKNTEHLTSFLKRSGGGGFNGSWGQKELSPALSFMILGMVLLTVFVMGAYFMKEYIKAWDIVTEKIDYDLESLINDSQNNVNQELDDLPSI
ncbi:hypothetical protein K9K85_02435 [Patescibacteria group bacterium]|nr:hypothetical protein [Patescibacteria group bacterium]